MPIRIGPKGGRYHIVNGRKVYLKSGSGNATKGWAKAAPKRGKQRQELLAKYGPKCFLQPSKLKYPVCNRKGVLDRRGVISAKIRATRFAPSLVAKANKLLSLFH